MKENLKMLPFHGICNLKELNSSQY